jgi:phospholipid/cholesterol/gamma-HCH transport system substrate-binding protein
MKLGLEMRKGVRDITLASRIFLGLGVMSLVAAVVVLAYHQGAFTQRIQVYFLAGSAAGMNKGMAVKLVGFKVGSVESIAIDNDRRVEVELKVDARYAPMIDADATVRLIREAIIGSNVLEFRPGSGKLGPVQDKAILLYEREPSVESSMMALLDQVSPIVTDIRQITVYLSAPDSDWREAVRSVNRTAGALADASVEVKKLIATTTDRIDKGETQVSGVLGAADKLLQDAGASLSLIDGSLKKVDAAIPGMTSKLDQTLENIRAASEAVRGMVAGELSGVVGEAGALVSDTSEVMRGAKRSWPVSNFVPPPRESLLRLDGEGGLTAVPADGVRDR